MVNVKPVKLGNTERMSFGKIDEVIDMPNLIDIQKASYKWLLDEGLKEVFKDVSGITDYQDNLVLDFIDYTLDVDHPNYSVIECKVRDGIMRFVSSNTNYVEVNDGQGIIQTAFTNFVYNWSPNGLGGVTVQGSVNGISMRQDKDGNIYYNYGINGIAVSATVSIVLTGGTNQASVTINPNFSGNTLTMNGYLVPYNESGVFQGTTW